MASSSIGNTDGINFPFQLKVLQLLGQIASSSQIGSSPQIRVPHLIRPTIPGSIAVDTYSASFSNVGEVNATVLGAVLKPKETINFSSEEGMNNKFAGGSFTYDATDTELIIIYTT